MAKVTSKLQLTVPKIIADECGIRPGDNVDFIPAGESVRLVPSRARSRQPKFRSVEERLEVFRKMVERQREREVRVRLTLRKPPNPPGSAPGSLTKSSAGGEERTFIHVAALLGTNVLVYAF